jgi:hypothetical protein
MQRFLFLIILLLLCNNITAQDLEFDVDCLLFQDTKTGSPILILQDSILYKGDPLTRTKYSHTKYPDKLSHYIPYSINEKAFLVHDGSGPVLEFRNDSIVACNKKPEFRSQYGSSKFVYKNELYLFGGYGLFTYKNILTKYDAKDKDWIQVQTLGEALPSPRSSFYSCLVNENLYVFGGIQEDPTNFPNFKKCDNTVWRLNLPTMQWQKIGRFDSTLFEDTLFSSFPADGKLYLISLSQYRKVLEIDFEQNTLKTFAGKTLLKPTQIYFDNTKKELVCVTWMASNKYKVFQTDLISFLGKPIEESVFILAFHEELTTASLGFGIAIAFLFIVLGIAFFLKKHKKNNLLPFNGIVFKKETGKCYYKNRWIDSLDQPELRVLLYLIENEMRFVPLNELNHLFENENNSENYLSIVKRRQLSLASLLKKLTTLTSVTDKEVFLDRKNPEDKRIKEIKISPSFLKIK